MVRQFVLERELTAVAAAGVCHAPPTEQIMPGIKLNVVELLEIVRVCGSMQLDKCPASYLSDYLATGLATLDPDLSAKVRRLDENQLETLCKHVKGFQGARSSRFAPRPAPRRHAVSAW